MIGRRFGRNARLSVVVAALAILAGGCATTNGPASAPSRIEMQDQAGFTITEKARVPAGVRAEYAEALLVLGQGDHARGITMLEAVVDAAPRLSAPRIDLAIAYRHAGRIDDAETSLLRVLDSKPDHPVAHNELGIVYRRTGRFAEARARYEAALAVYPGYHYARRNLAVLCDLYLDDPACALENYEAYMTTVVSEDEAAMWLAAIRLRMGETEE